MLLEPLKGHPKELREFIENTLEAPFEGTKESKEAVVESIMTQFPAIAAKVRKSSNDLEKSAKAADRAEKGETPSQYRDTVDPATGTEEGGEQ